MNRNMQQLRIQTNKPAKRRVRPKDVLVSAAISLKRVFKGGKMDVALWMAAREGDDEKIMRLLKAGAHIRPKSIPTRLTGWTALHVASMHDQTQSCALLIDEYAESGGNAKELIAAKDSSGWTALHWTAMHGHTETCKFLIGEYAKAGGDVRELIAAKSEKWSTALHIAARDGHTETCKLLVKEYAKAGGDLKRLLAAITRDDEPAWYEAKKSGHADAVQFLGSMGWLAEAVGDAFLKPFRECVSS